MKLKRRLILGLILLTLILPAGLAKTNSPWPIVPPEDVGMDSSGLIKLLKFLNNPKLHTHSIIMIRDGKLVTEGYFYPYRRSTLHNIYSCTKSVVNILTGIAFDQGYLESVHQELGEFFPELKTSAPEKSKITIRDLLTMRSGLKYTHGDTNDEMMKSPNWIRFILSLPLCYQPGAHYNYSDCDVQLLAAVLQKTTGKSLAEYADKNLFSPLNITDYFWPADPQGIQHGFSDLSLNSLDMAKLGDLYLNTGCWNERQIVSSDWVKESTRTQTYEENKGYGYLWWMENGGFAARGSGGQFIFVMPQAKVVTVCTYGLDNTDKNNGTYLPNDIRETCFKSNSTIPANPVAYQELNQLLRSIEAPPTEKSRISPIAEKILGRTYRLSPSKQGLNSIAFLPDQENMIKIRLKINHSVLEFPVSINNRFTEIPNYPFFRGDTVFIQGYWKDNQTLDIIFEMGERRVLTCEFNETASNIMLTLIECGEIDFFQLKGTAQ